MFEIHCKTYDGIRLSCFWYTCEFLDNSVFLKILYFLFYFILPLYITTSYFNTAFAIKLEIRIFKFPVEIFTWNALSTQISNSEIQSRHANHKLTIVRWQDWT